MRSETEGVGHARAAKRQTAARRERRVWPRILMGRSFVLFSCKVEKRQSEEERGGESREEQRGRERRREEGRGERRREE